MATRSGSIDSLNWLPIIFCLIVATAGWYYIFYTHAAERLASVEAENVNRFRVRLRRIGGFAMMMLALVFYIGLDAIDKHNATAAVGFLIAVILLLTLIVTLGLYDLRLTNKIRRAQQKQDEL